MKKKIINYTLVFISFFLSSFFVAQPSFSAGNTMLSFSQVSPVVGSTFTVDVLINSGTDTILNTDLFIQFDPTKLQALSITPGAFLPGATEITTVKQLDNTNGQIVSSFYTTLANAKKGSGALATITFKALSSGNTTISFDKNNTVVYAINIGNAASSLQSKILTISASATTGSSPTSPTATPTQSQATTPTVSQQGSTALTPNPTLPPASFSQAPSNFLTTLGNAISTTLFGERSAPIPTAMPLIPRGGCVVTEAQWISSKRVVLEEEEIRFIIQGKGNCNGKFVIVEVRDDDGFKTDHVKKNPSMVQFIGTTAVGMWVAEWQEDLFNMITFDRNPEYFFRVGISGTAAPVTSQGFEVKVIRKEEMLQSLQ